MKRFQPRTGFTLIELLVVIAIIGVLVALSTGAFFRVRASQTKSATEATLTKLNTGLDNRWKAINEQVKEDAKKNHPGYQQALALANQNHPDVAKALWMYARVKNEFPMSFPEARNPVQLGGVNVLPPRAAFSSLPNTAPTNVDEARNQAAACFFLAISTSGGGGAEFSMDSVNNQIGEVTVSGGTFKCFKDNWGNPITFLRHCYNPELNGSPYARTGQVYDPFDPSKKGATTISTQWAYITQNMNTHTLSIQGMSTTYNANLNHVPTLISAGQNRVFENFAGGSDDLVSFRLRKDGARGD